MKHLFFIAIILLAVSACTSYPAEEYIADHTDEILYGESDTGFFLDMMFEDTADYAKSAATVFDLLTAAEVLYVETGAQYRPLKSVTVWIPHTMEHWNEFNEINPDGSESYEDTLGVFLPTYDLDTFIVAINPDTWRNESRDFILEHVFIHEIVHYVGEARGDSDPGHTLPEYWGDAGLVQKVFHITMGILSAEVK